MTTRRARQLIENIVIESVYDSRILLLAKKLGGDYSHDEKGSPVFAFVGPPSGSRNASNFVAKVELELNKFATVTGEEPVTKSGSLIRYFIRVE